MKFKLLTKILFIFAVLLTSALAANYANTIVMDKTNFNVQLYNCRSDNTCSNPALISESHVDLSKYTFNYFTDDYYAEYLFKEGYRAKGFIVHKYSGTDNYKFEKKQNCKADINNVVISNPNPVQGDIVSVTANVKSAFGDSDPGTPLYRPNKYRNWFDADTRITLQVLQGNSVVQELTQDRSIYMNKNENVNFQLDTTNLTGIYTLKVTTSVIDNICSQNNDVLSLNTQVISVSPNLQAPVAMAGPDRTVCLNQNVVLDGSSSYDPDGYITSYLWNFIDGFSSAQPIVARNFTSLGVFAGSLAVTDNDNQISQDNLVMTVNNCTSPANQAPISDAGSDKTSQVGQVLQFSGSGSYDPDGAIISYLWNFGDSSLFASGMDVSHAYLQNGTYTLTLVVTDNLGAQDSDTAIIYIGVQPPVYTLDVNITADPLNGTAPLEVEFDSNVAGHGPFTYFWDFDDGSNSTQADPEHEFDESGTYDVELTVRDDHGNQETEDITIRVFDDNIDSHENDIHKLSIGHVELDNETIVAGNKVRVDAELINNGGFREDNVILILSITELGITKSSSILSLSSGSTEWESLELEMPEDAAQGLYNLRIELRNTNYADTEYKTLTILEKNTSDALIDDVTENENKWMFVLEIVFAILLILGLITGIVLLIREIRRTSQL